MTTCTYKTYEYYYHVCKICFNISFNTYFVRKNVHRKVIIFQLWEIRNTSHKGQDLRFHFFKKKLKITQKLFFLFFWIGSIFLLKFQSSNCASYLLRVYSFVIERTAQCSISFTSKEIWELIGYRLIIALRQIEKAVAEAVEESIFHFFLLFSLILTANCETLPLMWVNVAYCCFSVGLKAERNKEI